jgi:hypothetical protein
LAGTEPQGGGIPEPLLPDIRSNEVWLVAMRCAERRRNLSCDRLRFPYANRGAPMRLITLGLTTILATLALAGSTFAATNANALTGTVGPGFKITMNKTTTKIMHGVLTVT